MRDSKVASLLERPGLRENVMEAIDPLDSERKRFRFGLSGLEKP